MTDRPDTEPYVLCHHLVGFFDVLGQSSKLRSLKGLPQSSEERAETIRLLKDTAGVVLGIRKMFTDYFEAASTPTPFSEQLKGPARVFVQEVTSAEVSFRAVSDSFIVTVSLGEMDALTTPISGVWRAFVAASGMWLLSLSAGHPIRGGIDVGLAIRLEGDEVYGPAIDYAYRLETVVAGGPRLVVGKTCVDYLNFVSTRPGNDLRIRSASEMSRFCSSMLRQDSDGETTLDPLGARMREISKAAGVGRADNIAARVGPAHGVVRRELATARERGDEKLIARYEQLLEYFDRSAPDWA